MDRIKRMKRIAKIRRMKRIKRVVHELGRGAGQALRS
jgi:hypothetical protein